MERRIVQDVVPKRSIRSIPVRKKVIPEPIEEEPVIEVEKKKPRHRRKNGLTTFFVWLFVIVSIAVLAFAASLVYSSATVKITPKSQDIAVNGTFVAKKDAGSSELQYEIMTITKQGSQNVDSTPGKTIETKAKGVVSLYNNNTTTQRIVAGTRLSNTKGLIYTTDYAVTIPARRVVNGKTVIGTINVPVTSEKAGQNYNMNQSDLTGDFKVVAYKGSPKYETVYGRLKSNITGGFSGVEYVVPAGVASSTRAKVTSTITSQVLRDALTQLPEGYIMFDNSYITNVQALPNTQVETNVTSINQKVTFYGIIFKKDELIKYLAKKDIQKFGGGVVNSRNIDQLSFTITRKDFNPLTGTELPFSLKGTFKVVGEFNEKDVKNALVDKDIADISSILSKYGTIQSADVIIRPFWKKSFPNAIEKITIEQKSL